MQRFKISNKSNIKLKLNILVTLLIFNFIAFAYITDVFFDFDVISLILFLLLNIALIISIFNIKFFEYDSSGEVISIRSFHPMFRRKEKRIEFPKNMLYDFWISQNIFGITHLRIAVKTSDTRKVIIHYKIQGCSRENRRNIENSFLNLKELNLNS